MHTIRHKDVTNINPFTGELNAQLDAPENHNLNGICIRRPLNAIALTWHSLF
jgi:hypothetical protein